MINKHHKTIYILTNNSPTAHLNTVGCVQISDQLAFLHVMMQHCHSIQWASLHVTQHSFITFRMRRVSAFVDLMHIFHTQHNVIDPQDVHYRSQTSFVINITQDNLKHTHVWILLITPIKNLFHGKYSLKIYHMIHIKNLVGIYINNRICLEHYVYHKKKR